MAVQSTTLNEILDDMMRWQTVSTVPEANLVRDLDSAIRSLRRTPNLPFYQKKSSLKVFPDVFEYPPAADHDYLIYLDVTPQDVPYGAKLRARYTSLKQFYENPDDRNELAEIWQNGGLSLGVRINNNNINGFSSSVVDTATSTSGYTASGDASNLVVDTVNFITNNSSIRFTITESSGTATVTDDFDSFTDADYQQKYFFQWIFLDGLPDSITLRFGADSSNYLSATITEQFAGQPFIADQWNLIAFDLNGATTTGTINTSTVFAYSAVILTNAPSGTYNLDESSVKQWSLLDYWYFSQYSVKTAAGSSASKQFFMSNGAYDTTDELVGPKTWKDVIMYEALILTFTDKENFSVLEMIRQERDKAWEAMMNEWPSLKPQVTTNRYRYRQGQAPINYGYYTW